MNFQEQIIEYRKSASAVSSLAANTDMLFLEKYGVSGKGGSHKFDGTMIPGNVYFFTYETNSEIGDKVPFINRNPLILYISSERVGDDTIIKCIDLTVTPPERRLDILQRFWDQFKPSIDDGIQKVERKGSPSTIRIGTNDIPLLFRGTGYNTSFTGFKYKFMKDIKWVDYSDWSKLPFLKYTSIQGLSINEIYSNYRSKLIE